MFGSMWDRAMMARPPPQYTHKTKHDKDTQKNTLRINHNYTYTMYKR